MDPLSITASVLAVLGAVGQTAKALKKLWGLKDAPEELASLVNEVSNWRMVLLMMHDSLERIGTTEEESTGEVLTAIRDILQQSQDVLQELDTVVSEVLLCGTKKIDMSRLSYLRYHGRLVKLQDKLRDLRQHLTLALTTLNSVANAASSRTILLAVERATFMGGDQLKARDTIATGETSLESQRQKLPYSEKHPEVDLQTKKEVVSSNEKGGFKFAEKQAGPFASIVYIATRVILHKCSNPCLCSCHRNTTISSPSWLRKTLGCLFVSSHGIKLTPFLKSQPCSISTCVRSSISSTRLDYYFPPWLLSRVLSISGQWSLSGLATSWHLRMPRVVSDNSLIFHVVNSGNKQVIANLIHSGEASLYDIDTSGDSLLWFA
ncbi:hypothetical protein BKA56DRAFT_246465 [Ilyonectria sp. MPI-CAGE-AT-0026]|nr:hypothetical protein BKA56DRAFT_246465 [Ilyonectria sp. MPI-CAGE-AT-0026]